MGAPGRGPFAGEYTAVEVGHSGEFLKNSAVHQEKHYIGRAEDEALLARIACLMQDVDRLLYRLHALPPEFSVEPPVLSPVDQELALLYGIGLRSNPALRTPRSELAVLAAQTRQEGAKADPMLSVELMDMSMPLPLIGQPDQVGLSVGVSQMLDTYGKRDLRRTIAHREEYLKELELAQMELDLMFEITEIYYELMGTQAALNVMNDNIQLMGILLELSERKFALGLLPQSIVLNAQVQLSLMERERIEMSTMAEQQGARLAGALGNPPGFDWHCLLFDAAYPVPPQIEWNTPLLLETALARRPDYQSLQQQKEQQWLRVELAHREFRPDVTVMGEYEVGRMGQDMLRVGVELPLFTNKEERQDAQLQEQYAGVAVIEDRQASLRSEIETRLRELQLELKMHSDLVDMYRQGIVPQARLALDSSISGFAANMMDFSELIMSQQTLLTQERELQQNYIHILHTLADIQVLTAGAFDPSPYYVPQLEPSPAVEGNISVSEPRTEPDTASAPFVEGLDLPSRDAAGAEPQDPPAESPAGPELPEGEFYVPFQPQTGAADE